MIKLQPEEIRLARAFAMPLHQRPLGASHTRASQLDFNLTEKTFLISMLSAISAVHFST